MSLPAAAASCVARKRRLISSSKHGVLLEPAVGTGRAPECDDRAAGVSTLIAARGLVAQLAAQNLADIGFRQFAAEFDVARHLVAGEISGEVVAQLRFGHVGRFLDCEQLGHFAGMAVGHADDGAFQQPAMAHRQFLDLVGKHLEAGDGDIRSR